MAGTEKKCGSGRRGVGDRAVRISVENISSELDLRKWHLKEDIGSVSSKAPEQNTID